MLARHKAIRQRAVDKANALADAAKAAKIAAVMLVKSSEAREKVIRRRRAEEAAAKAKAAAEEEAAAQALAAKEAALIQVEGPQLEAEDHDVPPLKTATAGATREKRDGSSSYLPGGYVYDGESDAARARRAFRAVLGPPRGERGGGGGLEADWKHTAALLAAAGVPLAAGDVRDATITCAGRSAGAEASAATPTPSPLALTRAAQVVAVEFPDPAHRPALCSMSEFSHLLPIARLASHFFRLDEDGNGTLSVSELVSAANAILSGGSNSKKSTLSASNISKSRNEGRIASSTKDNDNDGNASEPVGTQELLGSLSEALCANLLEQMDSDSDGRVDLAEFVHFFRCVVAVRLDIIALSLAPQCWFVSKWLLFMMCFDRILLIYIHFLVAMQVCPDGRALNGRACLRSGQKWCCCHTRHAQASRDGSQP